jgi:hypothetical protein
MGVDISAATAYEFNIKKPSGETTTWTPEIYGTNYLQYQILEDDLDETGTWLVQPAISVGDFVGLGETASFIVYAAWK